MNPPVLSAGGYVVLPADATIEVARVPVAEIAFPDNHCAMDMGHVVALEREMRETDSDAPPVLLLRHDAGHWLIEGRHRFVAAVAAGRRDILAVVTDRLHIAL